MLLLLLLLLLLLFFFFFFKCYFSNVNLKNSFGKVVSQMLAKIEMTRSKNRLFGRHVAVQHLKKYRIMIFFYSAYIYGANISAKSGGKVVFGGYMEPPWAPTRVKVPRSLKCWGGSQFEM